MQREREQHKKKIVALKATVQDQDLDLLNAESKHSKVSKLNQNLLKENEDLKRQINELDQRNKKRAFQFESQKDQLSQEQKLIQFRIEEDRNRSIESQ